MSTNYSLLFYLKKPKNYVCGPKPIYMRITVAGEPKEVSTGRECDPLRWSAKANRAKGTKEDIFVFCCYTGLSYADVRKLQKTGIAKGIDGRLWVLTSREKTETSSNIPLLPQALEIIGRYADYPPCVAKGMVLPVLSNQKMNSYLKEIADLCGITKKLTFHMARHTFATTVTLANNVPIETVSKMLGHTNGEKSRRFLLLK